MNTTLHLAPEEIMAFLDGELSSTEAHEVKVHLATCPNCSVVAAQFQETAQMLAAWEVPALPEAREKSILSKIETTNATADRSSRKTRRRWMLLGLGTTSLIVALMFMYPVLNSSAGRGHISVFMAEKKTDASSDTMTYQTPSSPAESKAEYANTAGIAYSRRDNARLTPPPPPQRSHAPIPVFTPLIARNVVLMLKVADIAATRDRIDAILAQHQGYAAKLSVANGFDAHSISASLHIPAPELAPALAAIKSLGKVQNEDQTGEDVSQQHIDLDARLRNARETENHLRGILAKRAGKMSDVLEVEEEISTVRGEIEQMEAEQQALEHRVSFATIDLTVVELDHENATTLGARLVQSLKTGWRDAAAMLLGIILFLAEDGPSILIWLAFLSVPAFFLWRRYKRLSGQE